MWTEAQRLAALNRYRILDTPREPEFDDVALLAADVFDAPIAVVNLIAEGRQWFKAEVGIGADELPLDVSICAHAILQRGIFVVPDTTGDERFRCNPLVTGAPGLRFYAGALLETPDGLPLGTVCVLDTAPRPEGITDRQRLTLEVLARQVMTQLELRRVLAEQEAEVARASASEEQLRLATEAAEVGLWDLDPSADRLFWPPRVKAMFGISADKPVSMADFYEALHPGDAERVAQAFATALDPEKRAVYDVEYRTIGKEDGLLRWVAAKGRGIFSDDGDCVRVIGTAIDITERKRAEQELRHLNETLEQRVAEAVAERQLFAGVVENSTAAIMVLGLDHTILAINAANVAAFERVYGKRPKAGDNLLELLAEMPEHQAQVAATWARALAGEEFVVTDEFGDPALERATFELRFNIVCDRDGRQIGASHTAYDVSDRVRAQRELSVAQEALRQSQKMEAMGQLTGGVAHDFNNLLTPILGTLDMLQRRQAGGERERRLLAGALQSAERARTLVQRLLAFARRQPLQAVAVNIADLIRDMGDLGAGSTPPMAFPRRRPIPTSSKWRCSTSA